MIAILTGALGTIPKRFGKGTEKAGNRRMSRDHPNYSMVKIQPEY